jgi:hypothetical protein
MLEEVLVLQPQIEQEHQKEVANFHLLRAEEDPVICMAD